MNLLVRHYSLCHSWIKQTEKVESSVCLCLCALFFGLPEQESVWTKSMTRLWSVSPHKTDWEHVLHPEASFSDCWDEKSWLNHWASPPAQMYNNPDCTKLTGEAKHPSDPNTHLLIPSHTEASQTDSQTPPKRNNTTCYNREAPHQKRKKLRLLTCQLLFLL